MIAGINLSTSMKLRGGHTPAWIAAAIFFAVGGCVRPPLARVAYFGVVERVEERDGDHFCPERGHKPLNCVYLRLAKGPLAPEGEILRVLVLDLYSPALYGQAGDAIAFEKLGRLPVSDEVWFNELLDYSVRPARQ